MSTAKQDNNGIDLKRLEKNELYVGLLLAIGIPIIDIFTIFQEYDRVFNLHGSLLLQVIYYIYKFVFPITIIISIRAGIAILMDEPNALKMAKTYILVFMVYLGIVGLIPLVVVGIHSSGDVFVDKITFSIYCTRTLYMIRIIKIRTAGWGF